MQHHAKFHYNQSNSGRYNVIFYFSRWSMAAILNFQIQEILTADQLQKAQLHHCAKFCQNWSNGCRDMVIFDFSKWWLAPS